MSQQRKLLIAARNINKRTGTGRTVIQHCRYFTDKGWAVIIAGEAVDSDAIKNANGIVRRVWKIPLSKKIKRLGFSFQVDCLKAAYQPDIVWGHGDNLSQDILSLHNCVHLAHEVLSKIEPRSLGSVAPLHERQLKAGTFKLLIANSQLMRQDVRERFHVPKEKIAVIHPGYDPKQFSQDNRNLNRSTIRQQCGLDQSDFVIGLVTSGDFIKRNVAGCLKAFSLVAADFPQAKLLIIGKSGGAGDLKRLCTEHGVSDRVTILPPRPDIERIYHSLDLCIHPAHIEEFGQVVQEAVMCGTPVLTSRMVGATDLFPTDPRFVVLGRPTQEELVSGMKTFISDTEYPRAHWEATHSKMKHNTWDYNFEKTAEAIEHAVKPIVQ